jgi:hydroxymethylpyrimidine kinase/phosphomethylpyrimidine kinase
MIPNVLSIAGSDPSGGAGIQADLKTFSALGCYGMAALTALTAQNTRGVTAVHVPPPEFLEAELAAVFADVRVDAVKIGMLATGDMVRVVARCLAAHPGIPVVLDPVLVATSGDSLGAPDVVDAIAELLLPLAAVVTPNLPETARLSGLPVPEDEDAMRAAAAALEARGARAVLVKGGHLGGRESVDLLTEGGEIHVFTAPRIATRSTHGTGCTLSSAIACYLAKGLALADAVGAAKSYLTAAIAESGSLDVGEGHGPVHHFHAVWPSADPEVR